jgi:hypothetical protein
MMTVASAAAAEAAKKAAEDWQKSKPSTIIEFDDHTIPAPGVRVMCSERFCGFHDGKTATVISLDGVRSIKSPVPQNQTAQENLDCPTAR